MPRNSCLISLAFKDKNINSLNVSSDIPAGCYKHLLSELQDGNVCLFINKTKAISLMIPIQHLEGGLYRNSIHQSFLSLKRSFIE